MTMFAPTNTKEKMIAVALDLFHAQGVKATSVDEVLEKSGTGKSQFYHYFKSKEGLVHSVLQFFYEFIQSEHSPVDHNIETWEDLERFFQTFIGAQKSMGCSRGCPIGTIANELENEDELIRQDVRLIFEYTKKKLSQFFHAQKAKGVFKDSVDPDQLADFALSLMQGGMLMAKAHKDIRPFEHTVAHAMSYFESLKK